MARTRELILGRIPDLDPYDQRLINPDTGNRESGDQLGDIISVPIMIIGKDERRKIIGTLSVSSPRPIKMKLSPTSRQSRILMAVNEAKQDIEFRPRHPSDPEPEIVVDRRNLRETAVEPLSQANRSLQNALKQITTTPLHGMKPLSATHKIVNSRTIHEVQLIDLRPSISNFKRAVFSNGTAGFGSPYEQKRCLPRRRAKRD